MDVTLIESPLSVKAYHLNSQNGDANFFTWNLDLFSRPACVSRVRLRLAPSQPYFTAPFSSVLGGRARLHPLQTAPILLCFSSSINPNLDNSTLVWLTSRSLLRYASLLNPVVPTPVLTTGPVTSQFPDTLLIGPTYNNGGFETAGATPPAFTIWGQITAGGSTVSRDTVTKYEGVAACRFTIDALANVALIRQTLLVRARRYRISFAALASAPFLLSVTGGTGEKQFMVTTGYWQAFEYEFTAGTADLAMLSNGFNAGLSCWLDNVTLMDITSQDGTSGFSSGEEVEFLLQPDQKYFRYFVNSADVSAGVSYQGPLVADVPEDDNGACFLTLHGK